MSRPTITDDLQVVLRGDLPEDISEYVRTRIERLGVQLDEPVFHTRVRLTREPNPAFDRPVIAQGNVILKGRLARAQVAGRSPEEAVDLLADRLQGVLSRMKRDWEARRGARPEPGQWRSDAQPTQRPPYFPRPVEERELLRHKSFTPRRIPPDEAAFEMDQLDYDFHLFTDAETARDAVIYRDGPTGYRLARVGTGPEPSSTDPPITLDPVPPPRLNLDEARERLELGGLTFVFFVDRDTDRGAVLYHRYDGHYGLITPA